MVWQYHAMVLVDHGTDRAGLNRGLDMCPASLGRRRQGLAIFGQLPTWLLFPSMLWEQLWLLLVASVQGVGQLPHANSYHAAAPTSLFVLSYAWLLMPWQSASDPFGFATPAWLIGFRWGTAAALIMAPWWRG